MLPINDGDVQDQAAAEWQRIAEYEGDTYLTQGWIDDGASVEQAMAEAQDPAFLCLCLDLGGLAPILADRHATAGLKRALIGCDAAVLSVLGRYVKRATPRRRPGPRPREGRFLRDMVGELRGQGLTYGQIARRIWGDPAKRNLASAHYRQYQRAAGSR